MEPLLRLCHPNGIERIGKPLLDEKLFSSITIRTQILYISAQIVAMLIPTCSQVESSLDQLIPGIGFCPGPSASVEGRNEGRFADLYE